MPLPEEETVRITVPSIAQMPSSLGWKVSGLQALLTLEGVTNYDKVVILAATNKPWNLDPAVERRFALKLFVDLPDDETRRAKVMQRINQHYDKSGGEKGWDYVQKFGHPQLKITDQDIEFIVKLTGMSNSAINKSKNREKWQVEDESWFPTKRTFYDKIAVPSRVQPLFDGKNTASPVSIYGYSLSDMNKMIDKAFNNASKRATESPLAKVQVNPNEYRWIPVFANDGTQTRYIKRPQEKQDVTFLDPREFGEVESYDLRLEDFLVGMSKYPSTIDPTDYAGYLYYVKTGNAPSQ